MPLPLSQTKSVDPDIVENILAVTPKWLVILNPPPPPIKHNFLQPVVQNQPKEANDLGKRDDYLDVKLGLIARITTLKETYQTIKKEMEAAARELNFQTMPLHIVLWEYRMVEANVDKKELQKKVKIFNAEDFSCKPGEKNRFFKVTPIDVSTLDIDSKGCQQQHEALIGLYGSKQEKPQVSAEVESVSCCTIM